MRVFISGVAGLLGSHIAREGRTLGWDVRGADNLMGGDPANAPWAAWAKADCRYPDEYAWLLEGAEVVYHCAAAPYEGLSVFSPGVVFDHTLSSTVSLLTASINAGVKRFVFCSSMSRYGHQPQVPFTEDMPPAPADPYAIAKVAAEQLVQNLCDLHGLEWVIAVPHNIYGPGQRYYDPYRNVAGIMINRVLQGKPPVIYGDGSQRRCLSYIDDVTGPLLKMATEDVSGEVFNVGPDGFEEDVSILDLANVIRYLTDRPDLKPEFLPARPGEVHTAHCSAEKARKLLGYRPRWELQRGLDAYIDWIREREARPFDYNLPIEITRTPLQIPATWRDRTM